MNGRLVILSGPSGVGKDTVINEWQNRNPNVRRVVAYTTRSPRDGELDGRDYNFVSPELFRKLADDGAFLEFKEVHGNYYATPLRDLEAMLADGLVAVLKIDVQGARSVMAIRPEALSIFLLPPDWPELENRMRRRGTEDPESMHVRLENAKSELDMASAYQHQVVNGDLKTTVDELESIIAE